MWADRRADMRAVGLGALLADRRADKMDILMVES